MSFQDSAHTFETPPAASKSGYHSGETTGTTCSISPRSAQIPSASAPVLTPFSGSAGTSWALARSSKSQTQEPQEKGLEAEFLNCIPNSALLSVERLDQGRKMREEAWPRSRKRGHDHGPNHVQEHGSCLTGWIVFEKF